MIGLGVRDRCSRAGNKREYAGNGNDGLKRSRNDHWPSRLLMSRSSCIGFEFPRTAVEPRIVTVESTSHILRGV